MESGNPGIRGQNPEKDGTLPCSFLTLWPDP